ncbi:hypothetical protein F5148DRAFT_1365479 [Russula earlei]|uniref:Uncharacterized protein n=1 Tax=Russula earlei TaxID=71964 RepID=A0ACC0UMA9_9AGAM|nr:hypothetical protein F5148DRAFT_1365479 [Russula earlei]
MASKVFACEEEREYWDEDTTVLTLDVRLGVPNDVREQKKGKLDHGHRREADLPSCGRNARCGDARASCDGIQSVVASSPPQRWRSNKQMEETGHLYGLFTHTDGDLTRNHGAHDDPESDNNMWKMYLKEVDEIHKPSMDAWREDSNGVIVLAALFSAIVGAFIIESYKKLSPDSGDQTVALLTQISQQLANFSPNGSNVKPSVDQSFSPGASILWVNGLWLMSLVLSVTSALHSTLLQEWARTYTQIPQLPMKLSQRARVTSFLFSGLIKYKISVAMLTAQALLHASVFLFFTGLVIFFFTIHKTMAIVVLIPIILFGLAYFMLTVLRLFDPDCPYHTPATWIMFYPLYIPVSLAKLCLGWIVRQMGGTLIPFELGGLPPPSQRKSLKSLESWYHALEHYQHDPVARLISRAMDATEDVDCNALTQLFSLLSQADEYKTSEFVACMPRNKMVELVTPLIQSGNIMFGQPPLTALRSCVDGMHKIGLDEAVRERSVLVSLHAVRHIAKAFIVPDGVPSELARSLLDNVVANFANASRMRSMWNDTNATIRIASRSVCALLAKSVLKTQHTAQSLSWLQDVFGETLSATHDTNTLELMNLKSFVYGVLLHQQGDLTTEDAISFTETLLILMNAGVRAPFRRDIFQEQLSALIGRIQQDGLEGSDAVVDKLRRIFHDFLYPHV